MSKSTNGPMVHPGEILREDFLPDYDLTAYGLARELCVARDRIESLVREKRGITADTALRLARYFGTSAEMWMNMQTRYDLAVTRKKLRENLEDIVPSSVVG